jgi:hypothetical protein
VAPGGPAERHHVSFFHGGKPPTPRPRCARRHNGSYPWQFPYRVMHVNACITCISLRRSHRVPTLHPYSDELSNNPVHNPVVSLPVQERDGPVALLESRGKCVCMIRASRNVPKILHPFMSSPIGTAYSSPPYPFTLLDFLNGMGLSWPLDYTRIWFIPLDAPASSARPQPKAR